MPTTTATEPVPADSPENSSALDGPAVAGLADAVVYDWDLTTDALVWGANVAHVFKGLAPEFLAAGRGGGRRHGARRGAHFFGYLTKIYSLTRKAEPFLTSDGRAAS